LSVQFAGISKLIPVYSRRFPDPADAVDGAGLSSESAVACIGDAATGIAGGACGGAFVQPLVSDTTVNARLRTTAPAQSEVSLFRTAANSLISRVRFFIDIHPSPFAMALENRITQNNLAVSVLKGRKASCTGDVAHFDRSVKRPEALLERIREALIVTARILNESPRGITNQSRVPHQRLVRLVMMTDPQIDWRFTVPTTAALNCGIDDLG